MDKSIFMLTLKTFVQYSIFYSEIKNHTVRNRG
jgi:hypothetical protein